MREIAIHRSGFNDETLTYSVLETIKLVFISTFEENVFYFQLGGTIPL